MYISILTSYKARYIDKVLYSTVSIYVNKNVYTAVADFLYKLARIFTTRISVKLSVEDQGWFRFGGREEGGSII